MKLTDKEIETALKQGKQIRRKFWVPLYWMKLYIADDFVDNDGDIVILGLSDIIADDWETEVWVWKI